MRRGFAVALAALVAAGAVVAVGVVLSGGGCELPDAPGPPVVTPGSGPADDLSAIGLTPGYAVQVDIVRHLVAGPVVDVVTVDVTDAADEQVTRVVAGLDATTGEVRWQVEAPGIGIDVAVADGRVAGVSVAERVRVFSLDAATGADRRCTELGVVEGAPYTSAADWLPIAAHDGAAVVAWTGEDGAGRMAAVGLVDGAVRWEVAHPGGRRSLAIAEDRVLADHGPVRDLATGDPYWPVPEAELQATGPGLFVFLRPDELFALDRDGRRLWAAPGGGSGGARQTQVAVVGSVLVKNDHDDPATGTSAGLRGLDVVSGTLLWQRRGGSIVDLLVDGDRIVALGEGSGGGVVAVLDPGDGELSVVETTRSVRRGSVAGGRLVVELGGVLRSYQP